MKTRVSGSGIRKIDRSVAFAERQRQSARPIGTLERHRAMRRALRAGIKGEVRG